MNNLLPGSFVLAQEHILELHKEVRVVEIDLLGLFFEHRDHFVDQQLDAEFFTILVDFSLDFVTRMVALQLVSLG